MPKPTCLTVLFALMALCLTAAAPAARGADEEPDFFTIAGGGFDVNDDETAGQFELQLRLNERFWIFKPHGGMFVTTKKGFYGYAGILTDVYFGRRWVLTPSFAVGAYSRGDGKDLGGPLEFRSALELAYRFDNRARLGVSIGHLSNASIYDDNPGTEFMLLNYSMPTDVFSR